MKTVISFLIEIFRRSKALFAPFYEANGLHADFSVETSPGNRKTQSFVDFDENCYFAPDRDIWSFKSSFAPFYEANVLHADFSVETSPGNRKTQSVVDSGAICYFVPD
jgi:hypothetical protein